MSKIKFIDLFCGIGGFHSAIKDGECVLACDIDKDAMIVYENNYGIKPYNDIKKLNVEDIPSHDLLCGGFPCQSFSSAGKQKGFLDSRGTLFFEIEKILRYHKPKYIILENVKGLVSHDDGNTWLVITTILKDIGYRLMGVPLFVSPVDVGTPQLRPRVFIVGKYEPENVNIPLVINIPKTKISDIYKLLDTKVDAKYSITKYEKMVLTIWDEFYKGIKETIIGVPAIVEYFTFNGDMTNFPLWKHQYVKRNIELYNNNKSFIDGWLKKWNNLDGLIPTHKKFEWQAGNKINSIFEGLIQFRPSGVRVKAPTSFPALVAIVQTSVVGKYERRLTPRECARLQDFDDTFIIDSVDKNAYKQFGNSVNVKVVETVWNELKKC